MPALALVDALEDFGAAAPAAGGLPSWFAAPPSEMAPADAEAAGPALDVDAVVAEAVERAESALRLELSAEHASELERERERHAAELEAASREMGTLLGDRLAEELQAARAGVTDLVTAVVARILGPVLADDVTSRSVAALADAVSAAMDDADALRIRITGPMAMYEALCEKLGEKAARLDFVEDAGHDLSVRIDDSLIETRVAEWSAAMEEALA